ncbi:sensor histidine kinase YehU [Caproiciproducens galactitolivorans]|uniref:Sensor histidine kinase YehU n=2 Tax=Caproiciproducens galactitolivorans TaxID=642589 RepID=A0A4Z0Y1K5_9FIRM|nr:sensor histidine kinase YehU [Caproiciproducens galactitolivorans]
MLAAQAKLKDNLLKEQKMKQKLSLDLLQEQVNPHFLYNTLDNICSLAEINENETLIEVVMNLSKFYRETLSKGSFYVTIKDEISITTAYLNIMRIRYFNKFEFTISCPDYLKAYPCLKLLLQPIVENSIYHGIAQIYYTGMINIDITESENGIRFTVRDNGVGISQKRIEEIWEEQNSHFGLKNVDQRIKLYYGDQYGLKIEQNADNGCTITLEIAKEV